MKTAAVFSVILAAAAAQSFPPINLPSTCAATLCAVGSVCKEETNEFGVVQARCVDPSPVTKPGECPVPDRSGDVVGICANTCTADSDCGGSDKCCANPCGATTCQTPVDARPSCDTVKCSSGKACVMQEVQCVRAPCYPQPVCVDISTKPGECPVPGPFEVGICASTCTTDSDCKSSDKCCKNGCGATTCQGPQGLIPVPAKPSCNTVKCGPGEQCEMKEVWCFRAPCPGPRPVCVPRPEADKPGVCPKPRLSYFFMGCGTRCRSDAHCPGVQKCCKTLCGARCQTPRPQPRLTCATMNCKPDYTCVMKFECNRRGCSSKPVCEPVKRCPFYPAWINPHCVPQDRCSEKDPSSCPSDLLCCSTDCGRQCVTPM